MFKTISSGCPQAWTILAPKDARECACVSPTIDRDTSNLARSDRCSQFPIRPVGGKDKAKPGHSAGLTVLPTVSGSVE